MRRVKARLSQLEPGISAGAKTFWDCYSGQVQTDGAFIEAYKNIVLTEISGVDELPGCPDIKGGYMFANDKPGFGIDIDEKAAARYPYKVPFETRGNDRYLDGGIVRP